MYKLKKPWIGVVNRSQADINRKADLVSARRREREFFQTSPDYAHLASRMGTEYLAKMVSKHLEEVIKSRIPGITVRPACLPGPAMPRCLVCPSGCCSQ